MSDAKPMQPIGSGDNGGARRAAKLSVNDGRGCQTSFGAQNPTDSNPTAATTVISSAAP